MITCVCQVDNRRDSSSAAQTIKHRQVVSNGTPDRCR